VFQIKSKSICEFMPRRPLDVAAMILVLAAKLVQAQSSEAYEQPPINYSTAQPRDAVTALETRLATGELKLTGSGKQAVRNLLRELRVPIESQTLVFSKTSFQRSRIRPEQPRAIYFSDTCYVGWVPNGLIEIAAVDPELGPIFYSFDPEAAHPKFVRDSDCLRCHGGTFVRGIPGVFVRSVFTDETGEPLLRFGSEVVDFRTPFTNRWGGWYVTGQHGTALHRGNVLARDKNGELIADLQRGANVSKLAEFFHTKPYLTGESDIVALLVLEHQLAMQNTLTRASLDCRRMLAYQKNLQRDLTEPVSEELVYDSVKRVFDGAAKDVVDDLLFKDEAALPKGLAGSQAFQDAFVAGAPQASDGSSLKDFHLEGHLFKNRCSYLIYSELFLALPQELAKRIQAHLARALHPKDPDARYSHLGAGERAQIVRILRETHPQFRDLLGE
jgi:hypothetical protein